MHKVKANLVVISTIVNILLVRDVETKPSIDESEAHCYGCHSDPDAKRNVVSLQNIVICVYSEVSVF